MEKMLDMLDAPRRQSLQLFVRVKIKYCNGTTNLGAHAMAHHNDWLGKLNEKKIDAWSPLMTTNAGGAELGSTGKWSSQEVTSS